MLVVVAGRFAKGGTTYHLLHEDVDVDPETAGPRDVDVEDVIPRCYFRHRSESSWQVKDLDVLPERMEPCRPCRDEHDTERDGSRQGTARDLASDDYGPGDLPNGSAEPHLSTGTPSWMQPPAGGRSD